MRWEKLAALLIVVLAASTLMLAYEWRVADAKGRRLAGELDYAAWEHLIMLADDLEFLAASNCSWAEAVAVLRSAFSEAELLAEASWYLRGYGRGSPETMAKLHTAFSNIADFTLDLSNDPPGQLAARLAVKKSVLAELGALMDNMVKASGKPGITGLSPLHVDKLLAASMELYK